MSSGAAIFAPPNRKVTSQDVRQKPQVFNEIDTETSSVQSTTKRSSFVAAAKRIKSTKISQVLPTSTKILPKVGHKLSDWLEFPVEEGRHSVILNSITLPFKWLLFTSKGLAGLPPGSGLRERLCNQSSSLGSVAGLYLVIAISAFLMPPTPKDPMDEVLVDVFGILMFFSAMALTIYICLSLTVMYPLLESIPDFAAYEAYIHMAQRWGGYELYLFNFGCQGTILALLVAAKVIYSPTVFFWMVGVFAVLYCIAAFMTREFFLAIDPITSLHMGLTNSKETLRRAGCLSRAIVRRHEEFEQQGEDSRREVEAIYYMDEGKRRFKERFAGTTAEQDNNGLSGGGDGSRRLTDSSRDSGHRSAHLVGSVIGANNKFENVVVSAMENASSKLRKVNSHQQQREDSAVDEVMSTIVETRPSDLVQSFDQIDGDEEEEEEEEDGDGVDQQEPPLQQESKTASNSSLRVNTATSCSSSQINGTTSFARSRSRSGSYEAASSPKILARKQQQYQHMPLASSPHSAIMKHIASTVVSTPRVTSEGRQSVPTLSALLLGDDRLTLSFITQEEGETIHAGLLAQGCRDTQQFIKMLRWQGVLRAADQNSADSSGCLTLCSHLRLPLFPFMEVVQFVKQYA